MLALLAAVVMVLGLVPATAGAHGDVLEVGADGDHDYESIREAVDDADDGDMILVFPGTYEETIDIFGFEGLTLRSVFEHEATIRGCVRVAGSEQVVIDGFTIDIGTTDTIIALGAAPVTDVTVSNNVIIGTGPEGDVLGIGVQAEGEAVIINNEITDCSLGILGACELGQLTVSGNTIENSSSGIGVWFLFPPPFAMASVTGNTIRGAETGLDISGAGDTGEGVTVTGNTFEVNETHVSSDYDLSSVLACNSFDYALMNQDRDTIYGYQEFPVVNTTEMVGYDAIQSAIDDALSGDTIEVDPGTYAERLTIATPLTLVGSDADKPLVEIPDGDDAGVTIAASGVTVQNIRFRRLYQEGWQNCIISVPRGGSWEPGFEIAHGDITLRDLVFEEGKVGAFITAHDVTVEDCHFVGQLDDALYFNAVSGTTRIRDNVFEGDMESPDPSRKAVLFENFSDRDPAVSGTVEVESNVVSGKTNLLVYNQWLAPEEPVDIKVTGNKVTMLGDYEGWDDIGSAVVIFDPRPWGYTPDFNKIGSVVVHMNDFSGVTQDRWGVLSPPEVAVDATLNYWGHASGPSGAGSGAGSAVSSNTAYAPWYLDPELTLVSNDLPLTVTRQGEGEVSRPVGPYVYGQEVVLRATPDTDWLFSHWYMDEAYHETEQLTVIMDWAKDGRVVFMEAEAAAPPPPPAPLPLPLPSVAEEIDPEEGGSVSNEDATIVLDVPPGATEALTTFEMTELPEGEVPEVPGTFTVAGVAIQITATDEDGNPVDEFGAPLTLTFTLTPEQLGEHPEDLVIMYYDEELGWIELETTVDPVTGKVTATFDHLTVFAVIRVAASDVEYGAQRVVMLVGETRYTVDNVLKEMDVAPFVEGGSTFVPVRFLAEAFGSEVGWEAEGGTVTLTRPDLTITVEIGSKLLQVAKDGAVTVVESEVAAFLKDGRTMLPFTVIAEAFGAEADYGPKDAPVEWVSFEQ
jgi:nitrous oxidase accessory protein NosD